MAYCPKCGKKMGFQTKHCQECGAKLSGELETPTRDKSDVKQNQTTVIHAGGGFFSGLFQGAGGIIGCCIGAIIIIVILVMIINS